MNKLCVATSLHFVNSAHFRFYRWNLNVIAEAEAEATARWQRTVQEKALRDYPPLSLSFLFLSFTLAIGPRLPVPVSAVVISVPSEIKLLLLRLLPVKISQIFEIAQSR